MQTELTSDTTELAALHKELADDEAEARELGGAQLAASFKAVQARLYDIIVRTDVGNVDVAWSQKEDNDDDLKRLNLARARELKQLKDEFHDILDEHVAKPGPKKVSNEPEMPKPTDADSGAKPADRLKPGGDQKAGNAQPTVKPDEDKQPKKAGSK
jgi:hypothetical protein